MYPSLDRNEVLRAVNKVHDAVLASQKHHRKARRKEVVFYINKVDRKLDRIGGGGDHSCYYYYYSYLYYSGVAKPETPAS